MRLILASASPRRKQILTENGFEFDVIVSSADENVGNLPPVEMVKQLALKKAQAVFDKHGGRVLGADTIVVFNGEIIGKPKDSCDAKKTLKKLSGMVHSVITGFAIIDKKRKIVSFDETKVYFNELDESLIDEYVATGSPLDKAGAYGIQDGFNLVKKIEGSYYNVVGLPIEKIGRILTEVENEE